jgi:signal transduction histidine kinase
MKKALIYFLFVLHAVGFSQKPVVYVSPNKMLLVEGKSLQIYEDKTNLLTANEVLKSAKFEVNDKVIPNFGVSSSSFWLKFDIKNGSNENELVLNLSYPNLDEAEMHLLLNDSLITYKMGKNVPYSQRKYNYPGYVFDLGISKDETAFVLIKIKSGGQIMAPIYIGSKTALFETINSENLFIGIYSGILLIMLFYNLFIYFTVKDKVYLYYVMYILVVGLVQICLLGYTTQFFWPNSTWLAHHSVYILSPLSCIFIIEFIKVFLKTKEFMPKLHKGFYVLTFIYATYILLDLFNLADHLYNIIQLCAMILSGYILVVSYKIMRMNYRPAKFLFYAWIIFLIGVFTYALKDVGVLPYNSYTILLMPIGSAIETALLSFALADRINILKSEKEISQAETLKLLTENERIIKEQNIILENKVQERTAELEKTNRNLKETQTQLVDSEKMASLGQLTAGISHEINNPINFVVSNIKPLKRDVQEILMILDKYNEITSASDLSEKLDEIDALKKKLDSDYLRDEINLLLKGIEEGANRTSEIVKGLKNFARSDEGDLKKINIHEGIDATLTLLNNTITNGSISVIKKYGELPNIECYPGKINQVLMNLLSNAIDALKSVKTSNHKAVISIETQLLNNSAIIRISDNGIGIPPAIISKIFDPFYTTKEVGEGTGLGLSIVYGIIKSHNGKIEVQSEENKNTTFTITLPVQQ